MSTPSSPLGWKTSWPSTPDPMIPADRWCAWTRSPTSCWGRFATRSPPSPVMTGKRTASTSATAPARSSSGSNRYAAGAASMLNPTEPRSTGPVRCNTCSLTTTPTPRPSCWSWTTSTPTASAPSTTPSHPPRRSRWHSGWRSTTPPGTAPGSTSPRSNCPPWPDSASTGASPTSTPSTPNSPPGNRPPTPSTARSTGSSPPPTPASNSATYTPIVSGDSLLRCMKVAFLQGGDYAAVAGVSLGSRGGALPRPPRRRRLRGDEDQRHVVPAEPERVVHRGGEPDLARLAGHDVELHAVVDSLQVERRRDDAVAHREHRGDAL